MSSSASQQRFIDALQSNEALLNAIAVRVTSKSVRVTAKPSATADHALHAASLLAMRAGCKRTTVYDSQSDLIIFHF